MYKPHILHVIENRRKRQGGSDQTDGKRINKSQIS